MLRFSVTRRHQTGKTPLHRICRLTLQHRQKVLRRHLYVPAARSKKLQTARNVSCLVPTVMPLFIVAQREPLGCLGGRLVVESVSSVDRVWETAAAPQRALVFGLEVRLRAAVFSAAQAQMLLKGLDKIRADQIQAAAAPPSAFSDCQAQR